MTGTTVVRGLRARARSTAVDVRATWRTRPEVLLGWLLVAHVALKVVLFPLVMASPAFNDETAYLDGAMALSNLYRDLGALQAPDVEELRLNVVGSGWFMPGMSVVISPIYLVAPDAPIWLVRGFIGLVMLGLFLLVVRAVERTLGPRWACVVVVFPGLVPSWVVFTYGAWGDLAAGLVLLLLLLRLLELFRGLRRGQAPTLSEGAVLGLLAIAALYLRSSTSILLAVVGVLTLVAAVALLRGPALRRALASAAVAAVVAGVLLAPWSVFASQTLEGRVLTTTTVPTVLGNTFGDPDELCFGPCDPDSTEWFRPLRYAREVGRATGTSEVEVLHVMSDHALRDLTAGGYLGQVAHNTAAYLLQPTNFTAHLSPADGRGTWGELAELASDIWTWAIYVPFVLVGLVAMLVPARRSLDARVLDLLAKIFLTALMTQPFVHIAGARYWATAGPFFAIAACSLFHERRLMAGDTTGEADGPGGAVTTGVPGSTDVAVLRWVDRLQVTLVRLTAVVFVVVAVAGIWRAGRYLLGAE